MQFKLWYITSTVSKQSRFRERIWQTSSSIYYRFFYL